MSLSSFSDDKTVAMECYLEFINSKYISNGSLNNDAYAEQEKKIQAGQKDIDFS